MQSFKDRLAALRLHSHLLIAQSTPMVDEREWVVTPEKYGVFMERRERRTNAVAWRAGHVTTSTATGKIVQANPTAHRPARKAQVTDGWTTGERERYFGQLTSSGCVEPDLRSEAERIFDSERDLIEYRAFKVKESFRMKVARTWIDAHDGNLKPKHDRDMRTQRQIAIARIGQAPGDDAEGWGLLAVEHRILSELRAEYSAVELDARSDEELIEQRRTGESDEAQTRDEIRSQARRSQMLFGSRDEDERHQSEAESAAMRDEAHEKWVEDVTVENRAALKESLQRYFFEFAGDEAYTGESKFPMWVEVDGQWRLEKQTLTSIWNAELKKRGLEYKALWTLAKMVDSRYDAQVKYRRRVKKAAHNSELAA